VRMDDQHLFYEGRLSDWLERRRNDAVAAVRSVPADRVLTVPEADVVEELMGSFEVATPSLRLDERYSPRGAEDIQIDVSCDPRRLVFDRSRPFHLAGTRLEMHVPFDGDPELFRFQPSSFTTVFPQGKVRGQELIVSHEAPADAVSGEEFQRRLDEELNGIQRYLGWVSNDCASFNAELRNALAQAVEQRKEKVLRDRNLEGFLRIPVERRPDASPVLAVPVPRRRKPVEPRAQRETAPFSPEPAISDEDYAAILETITSWRAAVERLPGTFAPMGEEALRDNLLVVLNNQFGTGGGEVFSRRGKTDILIQQDKGAVFITECKFWSGQKAFAGALDQLLGYLVWRDTKSALVLFVREKNVTEVTAKAGAVIEGHPRVKRLGRAVAGVPIYVLHHEEDEHREIQVALIVVPLPTSS
jgi:hypothetical protein